MLSEEGNQSASFFESSISSHAFMAGSKMKSFFVKSTILSRERRFMGEILKSVNLYGHSSTIHKALFSNSLFERSLSSSLYFSQHQVRSNVTINGLIYNNLLNHKEGILEDLEVTVFLA